MIEKYFYEIEEKLTYFKNIIKDYSIEKKIYSDNQGFIKLEIFFNNDSFLRIIEVKDIEIKAKIKYSYHFMDKKNNMIFRYDNAEHYKEIKSYPHHKHTVNGVEESDEPILEDVLLEIMIQLTKK